MYILLCIKASELASGVFWLEGETYQIERNQLTAFKAENAKFLTYFEPQNAAAQALYEEKK